jgi:hypothetical protein
VIKSEVSSSSLLVFRRRRGTPPQAVSKGSIYRYEFPVPVGSRSASMGTPPQCSFSPPYQSVKTSSAGVPFGAEPHTCSSAPLGDSRTRCDAPTPASAIGRRAGISHASSWPRSNGIRVSCTRASVSSSANLARSAEGVVAFYNQPGTCEQYIEEGKNAIKWTRRSCRSFAANTVRLQLHALAYNLGNFMWTQRCRRPRSRSR